MTRLVRRRKSDRGRAILGSAIIFVLWLIVLQPESRALLIVVDLVGFDLCVLLVLARLHAAGSMVGVITLAITGHLVALISRLTAVARWSGRVVFPREGLWLASSAMVTAGLAIGLHVSHALSLGRMARR